VTEREVLFDPVNIGGSQDRCSSKGTAAFGILGLQQMAPARASEQDFSCAGYLESFGHCFSGLNAFWASHDTFPF
jgi:hypothetical protein